MKYSFLFLKQIFKNCSMHFRSIFLSSVFLFNIFFSILLRGAQKSLLFPATLDLLIWKIPFWIFDIDSVSL